MSIIRASLLLPSDIRCLRYMISVIMIYRQEPMSPWAYIFFASDCNTLIVRKICVCFCSSVRFGYMTCWFSRIYFHISNNLLKNKNDQIKMIITIIRRLFHPVLILAIAALVILHFSKTSSLQHFDKMPFRLIVFSSHCRFKMQIAEINVTVHAVLRTIKYFNSHKHW